MTAHSTTVDHATPADWTVVVFALILVIGLYLTLWRGATTQGTEAVVYSQGHEVARLALNHPHQAAFKGRLGDSLIEIHDGRARFVDSPCRGKQCVHTGWLSHTGEVAACVPNGISLTIAGGEARYDSVVF